LPPSREKPGSVPATSSFFPRIPENRVQFPDYLLGMRNSARRVGDVPEKPPQRRGVLVNLADAAEALPYKNRSSRIRAMNGFYFRIRIVPSSKIVMTFLENAMPASYCFGHVL